MPDSQKIFGEDRKIIGEKSPLGKELAKFTTKNQHVSGDFDATFQNMAIKKMRTRKRWRNTTNKPLEIALESELRDVGKSLERLEKGDYGVCKYCRNRLMKSVCWQADIRSVRELQEDAHPRDIIMMRNYGKNANLQNMRNYRIFVV